MSLFILLLIIICNPFYVDGICDGFHLHYFKERVDRGETADGSGHVFIDISLQTQGNVESIVNVPTTRIFVNVTK